MNIAGETDHFRCLKCDSVLLGSCRLRVASVEVVYVLLQMCSEIAIFLYFFKEHFAGLFSSLVTNNE